MMRGQGDYQKERMFGVAQRVGLKLQKRDEEQITEFCSKIEVEKQVFKVFFHENSSLGKRDQPTADILPESVIHKILCNLSYIEASRMSILSKTWLQAWLTHPNLKFTVCSSYENINIVNNIMERYKDGKIPIGKFEFHNDTARPDVDLSLLIDKWLDIALRNGVKYLVYRNFKNHSSYPFPISKLLTAKYLGELVLMNCDLMHLSSSTSHVANCQSLRKLSLSCVHLDENILQTLLTTCPLIVDLIIDHCPCLKTIEVRNLQNIRSLTIKIYSDQLVKIQAPTLEHLSYSSNYLEELDIVEYQNLKSLEISCMSISNELIEHLISRACFLESLILVNLVSRWFNIFKSQSLRFLKFKDCRIIGVIDAPNLVSLENEGYFIPQLEFAKESSQLKHRHIILDCVCYNLDVVWFYRLRKFLSNSTSWSHVSLVFSTCNEIDRKDLPLHHRVAIPQVEVLDVNIKSTEDCPTFVDALLWSCHPRRLNLSSTVKMIIYFIDRLIYMKNSSRSTSHGSTPQLSQLKEVKAYNFDGKDESWHPVELRSEELKTRNPAKSEKVYFLLDW